VGIAVVTSRSNTAPTTPKNARPAFISSPCSSGHPDQGEMSTPSAFPVQQDKGDLWKLPPIVVMCERKQTVSGAKSRFLGRYPQNSVAVSATGEAGGVITGFDVTMRSCCSVYISTESQTVRVGT
jgi:hypothetical protein